MPSAMPILSHSPIIQTAHARIKVGTQFYAALHCLMFILQLSDFVALYRLSDIRIV